eukprot:TRINITY_DN11884_c0_g1_i7.p1 TRINITY_DN11884_c0_g1~~TRINITY_DN11884_c0_g1_i7.p1  ORF type:complete len:710 (-),score=108.15 TRINITY_DN11884_c0_g1_i7:141-2270(-)
MMTERVSESSRVGHVTSTRSAAESDAGSIVSQPPATFQFTMAMRELQEKWRAQVMTRSGSLDVDPVDPNDVTVDRPAWPSGWSACRVRMATLLTNVYFDCFIGFLLVANFVLSVTETNASGRGETPDATTRFLVVLLLVVFSLEVGLRMFVFRRQFFASVWNWIDFIVIAIDWTLEIITIVTQPSPRASLLRALRMLRALRVLRTIRTLTLFRELYIMLHGFFSALRAIAWATVLLFVMLSMWGILAVELLSPHLDDLTESGVFDGCERCPRAFQSVEASILTLFQQIVAGDSWGVLSVPLIETYPATLLFFIPAFISIDLGLLNLILSVIVDKAQQAQADDVKFQLLHRQRAFDEAKKSLLGICMEIDEDGSGNLSLDELLRGYDEISSFRDQMDLFDLDKQDMSSLFKILDDDASGDVAYGEFVDQLIKMKSQDMNLALMFLRSQIKEIRHQCTDCAQASKSVHDDLAVMKDILLKEFQRKEEKQHVEIGRPRNTCRPKEKQHENNPLLQLEKADQQSTCSLSRKGTEEKAVRSSTEGTIHQIMASDFQLETDPVPEKPEKAPQVEATPRSSPKDATGDSSELGRWREQVDGLKTVLQDLDTTLTDLLSKGMVETISGRLGGDGKLRENISNLNKNELLPTAAAVEPIDEARQIPSEGPVHLQGLGKGPSQPGVEPRAGGLSTAMASAERDMLSSTFILNRAGVSRV